MAITNIKKIRLRYVKLLPEDEESRRRIVLELQVRSVIKAAFSQGKEAFDSKGLAVAAGVGASCGAGGADPLENAQEENGRNLQTVPKSLHVKRLRQAHF